MIRKMLSVRGLFLITLFIRNVIVYAGDSNNSLWNSLRFIVTPTGVSYRRSTSGNNHDNDGGERVITSATENNNNNFYHIVSDRSISSGSPFINSPHSDIYKPYNYNYSNIKVPSERTVLSTVILDDSPKYPYDKFYSSKHVLFDNNNQSSFDKLHQNNVTVTLLRKNARKPFSSHVSQRYSTKAVTARLNHVTTSAPPSTLKANTIKLKPSVRLDEDDEYEDEEDGDEENDGDDEEEEEEEDEEEEEESGFDTGFGGSDDDEEEEEETEEVDTNKSPEVDLKDEEDSYEEVGGSPHRKKKHGGKKKKKKKKDKKKHKKGQFKIKHFKKLKKYMFPLLLAYKLKFFTLIPLLLGGLVLIVASTGFAGFFFALFAIGLSLQKH